MEHGVNKKMQMRQILFWIILFTLIHSNDSLYAQSCANGVLDPGEENIDCGGSCSPCQVSISQYGITWIFDKGYRAGQFVNGDYWVLGPVKIVEMIPSFDGNNNGWEVNPSNFVYQGFDNNAYEFNASLVPALPYNAAINTSIIKALSNTDANITCTRNANHKCPMTTAAVLTVIGEVPPDNGITVFRPPYFGSEKPMYSVNDLHPELLPSVAAALNAPSLDWVKEMFQRVQLDHKRDWSGRSIHPDLNMPDYGGDIALNTNDASLRLMLDDPIELKMPALISYVQMGIDWYYILKNGGSWPPNGGHLNGRKLPIIITGLLFKDQSILDAVKNAPRNTFQEDGSIYFSQQANNGTGKVLFGQYAPAEGTYWPNQVFDTNSRTATDPYGYIDGGHIPGESYQKGINSMIWKGPVIAMQLMPEITAIWNNKDFIDYVDRWVTFGAWAQPDPCAPVTGVCVGGDAPGTKCTYAQSNYQYGNSQICSGGGRCAVGICPSSSPYAGQPCGIDFGPSLNNDCGSSSCTYNPAYFKVSYGPDPARPGQCIPDTDNSDGIGRHPFAQGKNANTGTYRSAFTDAMWDKYRLFHCENGVQDQDEDGVDCGASCVYDADRDGYLGKLCNVSDGRYDCNDTNPNINPGKPEVCTPSGEFDDNCDGRMHESYYRDSDLDGINDCEDNCPFDCNRNQVDRDFDGIGDACDDYFTVAENFQNTASLYQKSSPSGLSFDIVSGSAGLGSSTHWGYNSQFLRLSGIANTDNIIVTKEGRDSWSNYTLKVLAGQKYTTGGIIVHYKDPKNYYALNLRSGKLERIVDGVMTEINGTGDSVVMAWAGGNNQYTVSSSVDTQFTLKVVKDAVAIRTFVDPLPITTAGSIGFFERGHNAGNYFIFDDIEILFVNDYAGPRGSCVAYRLGDVDSNGELNVLDVVLTVKAAIGLSTQTYSFNNQAADVDSYPGVSVYDAALIAQKVVGLIDKFPVEG